MRLASLFDRNERDDALAERGGRIVSHVYTDADLSHSDFHPKQIRRSTFQSVSFRGARFEPACLIQESRFIDCDFSRADMSDIADWQNLFENCLFERTVLDLAGIGMKGSRYKNCRFVRARFKKTVFGRAEFDDCEFIDCLLDDVDFEASSFERCVFEGNLTRVWFASGFERPSDRRSQGRPRPNTMAQVDFSRAVLADCMFVRNVSLETIIPPADGRHLVYDRMQERARAVAEASKDWPEELRSEGPAFLQMTNRYPEQDWDIVNLDDLTEMFGRAAPLIVEALGEPYS